MNITEKKNKNVMIIKRRRRKLLKRCLLLAITLISILVILCFKLPVFNIAELSVENNKIISSKDIIKLSKINKGSNIFYINIYRSKNSILNNPYISKVQIYRKLPNKCIIFVTERTAEYYNFIGNDFYIVDGNGIVLEKKSSITGMKLSKLNGFDFSKASVGKQLPSNNNKKFDVISSISSLMNMVNINVTLLDVSDLNNIQIYFNNLCIKLGNNENLEKKLNAAINIFNSNESYKTAKGYIDVSYDGDPVIYIEK
ncbi:MAG: FtsQ-type POTRA domain-containing protein [Bacillota bacterium]|nr:FtsQ-type POTRA domain-containing protein [Bacillota bacterium]